MELLQKELIATGWIFMTSVLTYKDNSGAKLKQMFVAPKSPFGTFVEFAQRFPGIDGNIFDRFDTKNIDDLYNEYDKYSQFLLKKAA